jgi:tetratricopeptide (TPR) repeat protein
MAGMLYLNSAVELSLMGRKDDSYAQLEKAFILYPSHKSQYMLLVQLNNYIRNIDYRNLAHLGYLIKASRLIGYGVERDRVGYYLRDIVDKILVGEEDQDGFEYIYEYLQDFIQDEVLMKNFTFHYLCESGRLEFLNARYSKALDFLESAYQLRPEDERTQDLLARSLGGYSITAGPSIMLEKIHDYDTAYAGVTDEGIYLLLKLQTYLVYFGDAFQLQDYKTGELYMDEFEKLLDLNPGASIDQILVGHSYSSAAIYYYRKGKLTKSRQVIEKGLTYAPDNIELKLKLAAFD